MNHPYKLLDDKSYWYKFVSQNDSYPIKKWKFDLSINDRISNFGSCFALNIEKFLKNLNFVDLEPYPDNWPEIYQQLNYSNYSARYGNIYNPRQLRQLFDRALNIFKPKNNYWLEEGLFIDPFRPALGWKVKWKEEYDFLQSQHLNSVAKIPINSDCIVFTLGLTEAWFDKLDGAVFPSCPGTIAGKFDEKKYGFINFSIEELTNDLLYICELFKSMNKDIKIILTLSPVPMIATATNRNVFEANLMSKINQKISIDNVVNKLSYVDYFPSFEMVQFFSVKSEIYENNKRNIKPNIIEIIMKNFLSSISGVNMNQSRNLISGSQIKQSNIIFQNWINRECEEEFNRD